VVCIAAPAEVSVTNATGAAHTAADLTPARGPAVAGGTAGAAAAAAAIVARSPPIEITVSTRRSMRLRSIREDRQAGAAINLILSIMRGIKFRLNNGHHQRGGPNTRQQQQQQQQQQRDIMFRRLSIISKVVITTRSAATKGVVSPDGEHNRRVRTWQSSRISPTLQETILARWSDALT
jgi:hypothetical protein